MEGREKQKSTELTLQMHTHHHRQPCTLKLLFIEENAVVTSGPEADLHAIFPEVRHASDAVVALPANTGHDANNAAVVVAERVHNKPSGHDRGDDDSTSLADASHRRPNNIRADRGHQCALRNRGH